MAEFDAGSQERQRCEDKEKLKRADGDYIRSRTWARFVPAILVIPVWLYIVVQRNLWSAIFHHYWPATVGMSLGSFIAGSTPLGGGVVAFPLGVLVLHLTPGESRDVAVLVQSVGMNAAAYLLYTTKPELLHAKTIITTVCFGTPGALLALSHPISPYVLNLLYTLLVFEFAIVFAYTNNFSDRTASNGVGKKRGVFLEVSMAVAATAGGYVTGNIGSGSDIVLYAFGVYVWNVLAPQPLSDNVLTASSVVVMGTLSAVVVSARALSGAISHKALLVWGSMVLVVVIGAPVGSMVLTPRALPYLRCLFYSMAVLQFVLFATLKINGDGSSWLLVGATTCANLGLLAAHWAWGRRRATAV